MLLRVPHPSFFCSGGEVSTGAFPPLGPSPSRGYTPAVPWGLKRFQQTRQLHFITFSCYRRRPFLDSPARRELFERALEDTRRRYALFVTGYVVMPEHVHLLLSEPERGLLATAIQAMKQSVARRLALRKAEPFWQARYYDFNVWSEYKRIEKLKYMHRNPVKRGLVARPEDWRGAAFCTTLPDAKGLWRLNPHGQRGEGSAWESHRRRSCGSSNIPTRAKEARVGHPQE